MMKTAVIAMLGVLALPGGANAQAPAAPLVPTGQWVVEGAENMCILSHSFGTGSSQVTLGFRPWPMGEMTEVVLMYNDSSSTASLDGKGATLSLSSAGPEIEGDYSSYWLPKRKMRLVTLNVEQAALAELGSASAVTMAIPKGERVSVALPPSIKAALSALDKCDDTLLRSWGVDPAEQMVVATPAQPISNIADWITDDDYPPNSIVNNQHGMVKILWTIGVDGRVSNCIPVIKSGLPWLDETACSAITRRGRYRPALDKDGKPVITHASRRVIYRLAG
jgi:hypothetical protein